MNAGGHMPLEHLAELAAAIREDSAVVEWGAGQSTLALSRLNPRGSWLAIEEDVDWATFVLKGCLGHVRVSIQHPEDDGYLDVARGRFYDLAIVDGRMRRKCVLAARLLVKPGGFIALHDAQRPWYHCACEGLEKRVVSTDGDLMWLMAVPK